MIAAAVVTWLWFHTMRLLQLLGVATELHLATGRSCGLLRRHSLGDALSLEHGIELVLGGDLRHLRYLRGGAGLGLRSAVWLGCGCSWVQRARPTPLRILRPV